MPWFKVDDNLAFHHKVVAAGNPAVGLWARAGSLCAQQLTDGFVADHMAATLGTRAQAERLVEVGLWDRVDGGYRFHGWAERQPSKADVEAERAAAAERMRVRRAERKAGTKAGTNARERFTSGVRPQSSDALGVADTADETLPPDASPQVNGLSSPEQTAKFGRSSGEVRDVFGDPDPTRPDPTSSSFGTTDRPGKPAAARKRALPEDFRPSDAHEVLATELGVDLRAEWPQFVDHHRSKGSTMKDWDAALRTWIRNAKKFGRGGPATATATVTRLPRFDELEEPPSGLSPAEYADWERGQREKRNRS